MGYFELRKIIPPLFVELVFIMVKRKGTRLFNAVEIFEYIHGRGENDFTVNPSRTLKLKLILPSSCHVKGSNSPRDPKSR